METLASILPAFRPSDVAISVVLKVAYFHIPIRPSSRDPLGFAFRGETVRFKTLSSVSNRHLESLLE